MDNAVIAEVCHEANRAYCRTIGDNSQPSWADVPQRQKDSAMADVAFHLLRLDQDADVVLYPDDGATEVT